MNLSEYEMKRIFACNLIFLRKSRKYKLSQKALARLLNISKYRIQNYELCRAYLNAYDIKLIANYFSCSMDKLLTIKLYERKGT
jgi:Helix-turn-helix.